MRIFEKIFYKLIIDLISYVDKYELKLDYMLIGFYLKTKTNFIRYDSMEQIESLYNELNYYFSECSTGSISSINSISFNISIDNFYINIYYKNITDNIIEVFQKPTYLNSYQNYYIDNVRQTLKNILTKYKSIYLKLKDVADNSQNNNYSPCYAMRGYTKDFNNETYVNIVNKYNLFTVNIDNIEDINEKHIIKYLIEL